MKRRAICALLCLTMVLTASIGLTSFAQDYEPGPFYVQIDGEQLTFDQPPVKESDRVLVPMRAIFEALGAQVSWDEETKTATAVKGDDVTSIQIDNIIMFFNSQPITLDVPARQINDRTLVPVRAVSEVFGAVVDFVEETQTVTIDMPKTEPTAEELALEMMDALGGGVMISQIPEDLYADVYHIDPANFADVSIYASLINVKATEIIVVKAKDEAGLEDARAAFAKRQETLDNVWSHYLQDQYELVKNSITATDGLYAAYIVAEKAPEAEQAFHNALK